jgi:hypothetical protein
MAGCSGEFEVKARVRIPPHQEVKVSSTRRALPYKSIPQLMHPTGLAWFLSLYTKSRIDFTCPYSNR